MVTLASVQVQTHSFLLEKYVKARIRYIKFIGSKMWFKQNPQPSKINLAEITNWTLRSNPVPQIILITRTLTKKENANLGKTKDRTKIYSADHKFKHFKTPCDRTKHFVRSRKLICKIQKRNKKINNQDQQKEWEKWWSCNLDQWEFEVPFGLFPRSLARSA